MRNQGKGQGGFKTTFEIVSNAWMGHQTAEQQKRYQHLFPQKQQDAIREAFG
jgi:hypothetical protein